MQNDFLKPRWTLVMASKQRDNRKPMPLILRISNAAAFDPTDYQ